MNDYGIDPEAIKDRIVSELNTISEHAWRQLGCTMRIAGYNYPEIMADYIGSDIADLYQRGYREHAAIVERVYRSELEPHVHAWKQKEVNAHIGLFA